MKTPKTIQDISARIQELQSQLSSLKDVRTVTQSPTGDMAQSENSGAILKLEKQIDLLNQKLTSLGAQPVQGDNAPGIKSEWETPVLPSEQVSTEEVKIEEKKDEFTADEIATIRDQALKEISHDRTYKQGKVKNWQKNEDMYYGRKTVTAESRANVELGRMQEYVHTLLSKVDDPLIFKYTKRKESQLKRVALLNSLVQLDRQRNMWDIKDLVAKKQCILYGRAVYTYTASDETKVYYPCLENVDVYDFLIDPAAGGIDIEVAMHLGNYGVVLTRDDLKTGAEAGLYIKSEVTELLAGPGNNTDRPIEENNKLRRTQDQNTVGQKELQNNDKFKFWQWFTTYKGERYKLIISTQGRVVQIKRWKDLSSSGMYPYFTYAAFPDLTEFWTPAFCDYVREVFMVQNVNINQMLDNAEAVNKPQKVINVGALEDLAQLKYRRDGMIYTKGDYDANKVVQTLTVPSINTPIEVFNVLEAIQEKASGVTAGAKGVSDEEGKVGIYQGNQEAAADRFALFNKSYSFGTSRFAKLYEYGVRDYLVKRVAVELIGPNGVELVEIKRTDIYRKGDDYGVLVEASNREVLVTLQQMQEKLKWLAAQAMNPIQNQKKAYEIGAKTAGFTAEDVRELLDTSEFGNSELMSEADRDLESLLANEPIKLNAWANNAYKQRMVDYLKDHTEDIDEAQFNRIVGYIDAIGQIVIQNEVRAFNQSEVDRMNNASAVAANGGGPTAPKNGIGLSGGNQINNNPANPVR